jgi:hypothetical protein
MSRLPDFSTRRRTAAPTGGTLLLVLGALTLAVSLGDAWLRRAEAARARASVESQRAELGVSRRRADSFAARERRSEGRLPGQVTWTALAPPALVVARLTDLLPDDVRLDALQLDYGSRLEVEAQVSARRPEAYDELLARLASAPAFEDVRPGAEQRKDEMKATLRFAWAGERP